MSSLSHPIFCFSETEQSLISVSDIKTKVSSQCVDPQKGISSVPLLLLLEAFTLQITKVGLYYIHIMKLDLTKILQGIDVLPQPFIKWLLIGLVSMGDLFRMTAHDIGCQGNKNICKRYPGPLSIKQGPCAPRYVGRIHAYCKMTET